MTLVVDASVAAKWVLPEDGADRAAALHGETDSFLAPSLIYAEIGNAIWKRATWYELSTTDALRALESAIGLFTVLVPMAELAARATEIAIELRHPINDCFYLALAERERAPLVSADKRLIAAAKRVKGIEVRVL
jgi:predicted nucleic acid-binding protein